MLFINTIHIDRKIVETLQQKFIKIFINVRISRVSFDNLTIKKLFIFDFIDFYNHFMNNVDVIDQFWCYYNTQQIHLKIWKFLWHFLLNTTIINNYKIINIIDFRLYTKFRKHNSYWLFRIKLIQKLYDFFVRIAKSFKNLQHYTQKKLIQLIRYIFSKKHKKRVQLNEIWHYCILCSIINRIVQKLNIKKSLQNLFLNSFKAKQQRQQFFKSNLGYELYVMFICKKISCWKKHLKACMASN